MFIFITAQNPDDSVGSMRYHGSFASFSPDNARIEMPDFSHDVTPLEYSCECRFIQKHFADRQRTLLRMALVAPDKSEVLFTCVTMRSAECPMRIIRLSGLDASAFYRDGRNGEMYSGALLINAGTTSRGAAIVTVRARLYTLQWKAKEKYRFFFRFILTNQCLKKRRFSENATILCDY